MNRADCNREWFYYEPFASESFEAEWLSQRTIGIERQRTTSRSSAGRCGRSNAHFQPRFSRLGGNRITKSRSRRAWTEPNRGRPNEITPGSKPMRMSQHGQRLRPALLASAVFALGMAAPAAAQDEPAGEEDAAEETAAPANSIVVTGSRIARQDYTATSPIVTVDADVIEQSSAVSLEANLNKLPQFSPALTQFDTQDIQPNANSTPGVSTISLRQLGANRNLVLIDGRRGTPVNGTGVIDINSIP